MPPSPSAAELDAARGKLLPDLLAPGLRVVLVGINPGLYSAAVGRHFARPGNRFWPTLHAAGFTPRLFSPHDQWDLLKLGIGLTNVVPRATARADQLTPAELTAGGEALLTKLAHHRPAAVGVLGVTAYRAAFALPHAKIGRQTQPPGQTLHSPATPALWWVLPNPSGLNAHFRSEGLADLFAAFRRATDDRRP